MALVPYKPNNFSSGVRKGRGGGRGYRNQKISPNYKGNKPVPFFNRRRRRGIIRQANVVSTNVRRKPVLGNRRAISVEKRKVIKEANDKRIQNQVNMILAKAEKPAMDPQALTIPVNIDAFFTFLLVMMEHMSMKADAFIIDSLTAYKYTAGEFAVYCYAIFMYFIKTRGLLTGDPTILQTITNFDELAVPVPLAKWMQGYAPYTDHGVVLKSTYEMTEKPTTQYNYPSSVSGSLPFSSCIGKYSTIPVRAIRNQYIPNVGDYINYCLTKEIAFPGSVQFTDFVATRMSMVSDVVKQLPISTILMKDIPTYAPDASAYAVSMNDLSDTPTTLINGWLSIVQNVQNDAAWLYTGDRDGTDAYARAPYSYMIDVGMVNYQPQQTCPAEEYINTFVSCWLYVDKYRRGSIMQNTYYCKQKLNTLKIQPVKISPQNLFLFFLLHFDYANTSGQNAIDWLAGATLQLAFVQCSNLVLRRLNQTNICYHCYDNYSGIQQYWVQPTISTQLLPATIAAALSDLGPVVHHGMIYAPQTIAIEYDPGDFVYSLWYYLVNGLKVNPALNSRNIYSNPILSTSQPTAAFFIPINQSRVNLTSFQYAEYSIPAPDAELASAGTLIPIYNDYETTVIGQIDFSNAIVKCYSGDNPASGLVHQHNAICGTSAMFTAHTHTPGFSSDRDQLLILQPDNTASHDVYVQPLKLRETHSLIQLSHAQLLRSYLMPWVITNEFDNGPVFTSKFVYQHPNIIQLSEIMYNAAEASFSPGSTFAGALAKAQQQWVHDRQTIPVKAINLTKADVIGCYWNDLYNELLASINPVVRKGAGLIGASVCGNYGAHCSEASIAIYDWISANARTEASDVKTVIVKKKKTKEDYLRTVVNTALSVGKVVAPIALKALATAVI